MGKKETLKERLKKKQQELKSKSQSGAIFFQKPDTTIRVRILSMGDEEEFIKEVIQFYLGSEIKGVISPCTFNEPCAIMESYEEFKSSDDDDEKEIASKFTPRKRYLAFCAFYKDDKGKEIDSTLSPKFLLLSGGVYQNILELYLDDDEWGDMTDPIKGYDIKITRTGSGKLDTDYSVSPCKNTKIGKPFNKIYDLNEEIKKILPSYEKTKDLINQYLGLDSEEETEKPKKKKKKVVKKKKSDLDD